MKQMTLREARMKKGWSQEDLEDATRRLGRLVKQQNISRLENGHVKDPNYSTVIALENALGVPRGTLAFGEMEGARA